MATVKMSGGKVVTKAGKVSCTCCVCCMYGAAYAVASNLPEAITLIGVGSLAKSGTDYGNTTNGVILESGVWAVYIEGVRTTQDCLIDGSVEDQFASTYLIHNFSFTGYCNEYTDPTGDILVTRESLCLWSGSFEALYDPEFSEPELVTVLIYISFDGTEFSQVYASAINCDALLYRLPAGEAISNTSPVGTYGDSTTVI